MTGDNMKKVLALQAMRKDLEDYVNATINAMEQLLKSDEPVALDTDQVVSLTVDPAFFKGRKPISVIFPDGREVDAPTWKRVVKTVIDDAVQDDRVAQALRSMSGKVYGRQRLILGPAPEGMDQPIQIFDDLYFESKFDSQMLLHILRVRLLSPSGYDVVGIRVKLRRKMP